MPVNDFLTTRFGTSAANPVVPWRCENVYCDNTLSLVKDGITEVIRGTVCFGRHGVWLKCEICGHWNPWHIKP